ncbi:Zinc/iron permease [Dillenia turbinata]|uniref:Zinc/iron permease n=1 Tax=Dillenia turbinata TaxID=194707 RepID=A0AAN8YYJ9_9MAGN
MQCILLAIRPMYINSLYIPQTYFKKFQRQEPVTLVLETMNDFLQSYPNNLPSLLLTILILVQPILASPNCTCQAQNQEKTQSQALTYKLVAMATILVASAMGVCLPFLVQNIPALRPENGIYFLVKAFAAGVILATGLIHILPDAFDSLTSPCIGGKSPWGNFPLTGFVAMMAAIATLIMESFATGYKRRSELRKAQPVNGDEEEIIGESENYSGHVHGSGLVAGRADSTSDLIRHRIVSQSPKTIKPLVAALSFHQFFEGMGLGGCISQAKFKRRAIIIMVLFFSLTTPSGIAIGIGISRIYNESSPTALIVEGLLNAASAGILIYMALVDLLAADFMNPKLQENVKLQLGANVTLLLGACFMSLLAKWGGT